MKIKHSLLNATLLLLFNNIAYADITAIEAFHGAVNEFTFSSQADAANNLFSESVRNLYPPDRYNGRDVERAIEITDNSTNKSFTIIRATSDTYVVAQNVKDKDGKSSIAFTTIQKTGGGVQAELYHYLLNESYSKTTKVTTGELNSATQEKVNSVIADAKTSTLGAVYNGDTLTNLGAMNKSNKDTFTTALTNTYITPSKPIDITPTPSPITQKDITNAITKEGNKTINNYLKSGIVQGNPASYVAQMAYYDQNLDLGGVANGRFDNAINKLHDKSRLAIKARLSNYSFSGQDTQVYTVTPSYTYELGRAWAVLFDIPMSYVSNSNSSTYNISMGAGVRVPLVRYDMLNWDLIPLARMGGANLDCVNSNSLNCADSSFVYSAGMQSNLGLAFNNGYKLIMHNQYSYQNINALAGKIKVNVSVFGANRNAFVNVSDGTVDVYRNGAQLLKTFDNNVFGHKLSSSLDFADTRFTSSYGSFISSWQEYGFNLNLHGIIRNSGDLKLGISYTDAKGLNSAISGTIGLSF